MVGENNVPPQRKVNARIALAGGERYQERSSDNCVDTNYSMPEQFNNFAFLRTHRACYFLKVVGSPMWKITASLPETVFKMR